MENYHRRPKTTRSKFENDDDSTSTSTTKGEGISTQQHNRPQQHGVMVISPNGKIRVYVSRGLEILNEVDHDDQDNKDIKDNIDQTNPTRTSIDEKRKSKSTSAQNTKASSGSGSGSGSSTLTSSSTSISTSTSNPVSNQSSKKPVTTTVTTPTTTRGVLTIKAQGRSIPKAVTVAEILKRRMEGSLHQFTEIGQITEQEIWDPNPDQPNLDPLTVSRHRPTIRIRLSKELPPATMTTTATSTSTSASTLTSITTTTSSASGSALIGIDPSIPGATIPRDEHADESDNDDNDNVDNENHETWPGAILDKDAAVRRFIGYQAPTGNDIYL
ncbi:hypothetical protein BX616_002171 [Lobosporangium transversale]|uniref:DNA/RNA-binding protein Alba-like domain-containing protein n=1 Tax=Lobosporangium transversale TaxID=64571 RepID=A0A1Y2G7Z4_9FUNG|nr:hypothetical protein BCR41DRAFT_426212 [Lobosporangium transversale]KAF9901731.1 hypothetical protein BX616_002171 [Lobosporangium transversale]ORZ01979.1 hypothetical protein BCR41DRAFT_426212 [Lobosporangium transversale]|eukprot:XP_021876232.1 hypothetical protein BCR41DRAFT_426212 [Lobosporangium transversale]